MGFLYDREYLASVYPECAEDANVTIKWCLDGINNSRLSSIIFNTIDYILLIVIVLIFIMLVMFVNYMKKYRSSSK